MILFFLSLSLTGYLLGSIPVGYLLAKFGGAGDLRASGSGSTGATNVVRHAGWRLGLLTVVLDGAKGALAAWLPFVIAQSLSRQWWNGEYVRLYGEVLRTGSIADPGHNLFSSITAMAFSYGFWWAALAAIIGHIFPIWLRFKGGKGVATYLGTLLVLAPWLGLAAMAIWLAVAVITRYSSLASILAVCALPIVAYQMDDNTGRLPYLLLAALLLLFTHRANIGRLVRGKESRITLSRKNAS
jgi:glycerol-3-phosphate acyltransferase PlsY